MRTLNTILWLALLVLGIPGCNQQLMPGPNSTLPLGDKIEEAADNLKWSKKQSTSVVYELNPEHPWVLMFIPRTGFDESKARQAGVTEDARRVMAERANQWKDTPVLVFATPSANSLSKLPDGVEVAEQLSLTGDAGKLNLSVELVLSEGRVLVSRLGRQP